MGLTFNSALATIGIAPRDVLLMRHQDSRGGRNRTVYGLWRDNRAAFEEYQSRQSCRARADFRRPYWASFVAAPDEATLFVGVYAMSNFRLSEADWIDPYNGLLQPAGTTNQCDLTLVDGLKELAGLLYVEWGAGMRAWVQYADRRDKPIVELRRELKEPDFPGYTAFLEPLSRIEDLPGAWKTALRASRGIYLLVCPRTREQYVGAAVGAEGFLGRWFEYARSGHGGNVGLLSRDPSDYQVSILETAGSNASVEDILAMEVRWKLKLQSREMGLNRN